MRRAVLILSLLSGLCCNPATAENPGMEKLVFPETIFQLDPYFTHHVIVAEKATHKLHLFRNHGGYPERVKTYKMATGKKAGNKVFQGDHRTPEGVYFFTDFLTHQDLLNRHGKQGEIYGVGAFVMDYPNPIDRMMGKTGGGIWLHSTNDETRIEKGLDSRGCIVTANTQLIDIAKYIELNRTTVIVVHDLRYLSPEAWQSKRDKLMSVVEDWVQAWQNEDISRYISHYHNDFYDNSRGNLAGYRAYKRAVFSNPGKPRVNLKNISVLSNGQYATINFLQEYASNTINDRGRKTLYLKRDAYYNWKIVGESWTKNGIQESEKQVAFQPSMRFFKTTDPAQIFPALKQGNN